MIEVMEVMDVKDRFTSITQLTSLTSIIPRTRAATHTREVKEHEVRKAV